MRLALTARTVILGAVAAVTLATAVQAASFGPWSRAASVESVPGVSASLNTPAL